jgi:hypothetical protein
MDGKFIEPLNQLTSSLEQFLGDLKEASAEAIYANLQKILNNLFLKYGDLQNHNNPVAFADELKARGRMEARNFPEVLRGLVTANSDRTFLSLYPFASELLNLYDLLNAGIDSRNIPIAELTQMTLRFRGYAAEEGIVKTLLEIREFAKAAAGMAVDLSISEHIKRFARELPNRKLSLGMIGVAITRDISPRMQSKPPYDLINWKYLQLLGDQSSFIHNRVLFTATMASLAPDFVVLANYFDLLVQFERTKYDLSVTSPAFPDTIILNQISNFARTFENPLNLERALDYLRNIELIAATDTPISRLAILRVIAALGEVSLNLSDDLTAVDNDLFRTFRELRNGIVHAEEYPSIRDNVNSLINNPADRRLLDLATNELPRIREFLSCLHDGMVPAPLLPILPMVKALHTRLTKQYKLTLAQKRNLLSMLPVVDEIEIADRRNNLEGVLRSTLPLPGRYDDFVLMLDGLGVSKGKAKDLFVKLTQVRLCNQLEAGIRDGLGVDELKKQLSSLSTKNPNKQTLLTSDDLDLDLLNAVIAEHHTRIQVSEDEIKSLLQKVPLQRLNITADKEFLRNIILDEARPNKADFGRALDRAGLSEDQKAQFQTTLGIIEERVRSSYDDRPHFAHRRVDQYRQVLRDVEHVQGAILELQQIIAEIGSIAGDKEKYEAFQANEALIYACEYAFNIFVDRARNLEESLDSVRDYSDIRTRSIFLTDPYRELQSELAQYVVQRNNIFHLDAIYTGRSLGKYWEREQLYDTIMHRTEGRLFPEAIEISKAGVRSVAARSKSLYQKLQELSIELRSRISTDKDISALDVIIFEPVAGSKKDLAKKATFRTQILTIDGNGDCMFNSIIQGLRRIHGAQLPLWARHSTARIIRNRVADEIDRNMGQYFVEITYQLAQNIRDGEFAGYPAVLADEMQRLYEQRSTAFATGVNMQQAEDNIEQFVHGGAVGQYIDSLRNPGELWGGAVELGVLSRMLGAQFMVYRRHGEFYHIDNTGLADAPRIDLDYTGNHYNLILLPGMESYAFNSYLDECCDDLSHAERLELSRTMLYSSHAARAGASSQAWQERLEAHRGSVSSVTK